VGDVGSTGAAGERGGCGDGGMDVESRWSGCKTNLSRGRGRAQPPSLPLRSVALTLPHTAKVVRRDGGRSQAREGQARLSPHTLRLWYRNTTPLLKGHAWQSLAYD
jgi:hypothetical protein